MKKFSRKDLSKVVLPRWVAFVVSGDTVTTDQAAEIIIRTDSFRFGSLQSTYVRSLYFSVGHSLKGIKDPFKVTEEINKMRGSVKSLPLSFLNTDRISSSFVGGVTGWCDWDGTISSKGTNLGKHPDVISVLIELKTIAKAFPFLSMSVQVFNKESCYAMDRDFIPLVEYRVHGGKVKAFKPDELLFRPIDIDNVHRGYHPKVSFDVTKDVKKLGCSVPLFKSSFLKVKEKFVGM
jgi:hypothetical protein